MYSISKIFLYLNLSFAIYFLFFHHFLCAQISNEPFHHRKAPRIKKNFDKVGHYEIGISLNKSILNRGDEVQGNLFFTGYGKIGLSKVAIYPSSAGLFDSSSKFYTSFGKHNGLLKWGIDSFNIGSSSPGWVMTLGGIQLDSTHDYYWDRYPNDSSDLLIITEMILGKAPLLIKLKLKNDVEPGEYKISFLYTYFDGQQWQGSTQTSEFKVNSFSEQYATPIAIIGVIIGLFSLFPLVESGLDYYKSRFKKKLDLSVKENYIPKKKANRKGD